MAGQGCPLLRPRAWLSRRAFLMLRALIVCLTPLALGFAASADAAELDVRLRIAWGGGEARSWQGTIHVTSGQLTEPMALGLEADAPGSIQQVDRSTLRIFPRTPHSYDGCDIRVQAPVDAKLLVSLSPDGSPAPAIEIPLSKAAQTFHNVELDDRNNRLLAQRAPGDMLRVKLHRDSLVFAPGEKFEADLLPTSLPVAPSTTYLLSTTLQHARSDTELNRQEEEVRTDENGVIPPLPMSFPTPLEEGVYDIRIALYPKRLTTSLVRGKPIAERKIQFIVVAPAARILPAAQPWRVADEVDPANPRWWDRLPRFGSLRKMPVWSNGPIGSGPIRTRTHLDKSWVELPVDGWQAYPLSIATPGKLHMLEIDYPGDLEQTLGVSLVEPNAAGQVVPIGLDTGIDVPAPRAGQAQEIQKLRIPFWPQTRSPVLVLTNRHGERTAVYGRIVVQTGPEELPALELPPVGRQPQRVLAAYYDKPLIAENFSATEALDPITGRSLDDWATFYDGARRMVEYLQHAGFNAVVLTVACEGSAIYPSRYLEPTPKYDTGTFFELGQDPVRKDVLELVLRMCDRAGIQVIPAIQFSSPLPELETLRLTNPQQAVGIEPVGPDGRTWGQRHGLRRGMGVYYNPLDPRVQQAVRRVVNELADRYGKHPSFGGVALHSGNDTFTLLPEEGYSFDDATLAQFQSIHSVALPGGPDRIPLRAQVLSGPQRKSWLAWRAKTLSGMFSTLQADLRQRTPSAKLYITSADLFAGRNMQQWLRPTLPPANEQHEALLSVGIDPALLGKDGPVFLPRPQRIAAGSATLSKSMHATWNESPELSALFTSLGQGMAMHYLEPAPLQLPQFDSLSPFGAENTHTWFIAQIPPAGAAARQRFVHSVAAMDARTVIDGGWLLPLGQESAVREFAQVYRRLPPEPFRTVEPRIAGGRAQPILVRTLRRDNKTYFYLVNDSPWPVTVELDWQSVRPLHIMSYSKERETSLTRDGTKSTWVTRMEPYDLFAGEVDSADADISAWRSILAKDVEDDLREQIRDLRQRTNSLRSPEPRNVLSNPSFEQDLVDGQFPGWLHASGEGITVELDPSQGYRSPQSLHVVSRRKKDGQAPIVWIRSEPFAPPPTGRLSVVAWLRVEDPTRQPKLRLAIEGKLDGETYYRPANVGVSEDGRPLKPLQKGWSSYRFAITNLPLTGLTDLRVGFDLMDEGEVWIDSVEVYDLWFEDNERDELLKYIAAADFQLSAGQVADCHRFLQSYWPRFLRQFVKLDEEIKLVGPTDSQPSAVQPPKPQPPQTPPAATTTAEPAERPSARTSVLERVRTWWPRSGEKKPTERR